MALRSLVLRVRNHLRHNWFRDTGASGQHSRWLPWREREQLADELIEFFRLALHAIELRGHIRRGIFTRQLQRHAQPGKRRTQFVRNITQQELLRATSDSNRSAM